jgi:hypothetical protein
MWKSFKPLNQTATPSVLVVSPQFGQVSSIAQVRCLKKESSEGCERPTADISLQCGTLGD